MGLHWENVYKYVITYFLADILPSSEFNEPCKNFDKKRQTMSSLESIRSMWDTI